jgi:hypothetical protein
MPVEVGETVNYIIDSFLNAPIVHIIAKNPIYTALTITFIVIIIVMFIFRDVDSSESVFILSMRSGFWIAIFMIGVLSIHNKVLSMEQKINADSVVYNGVFTDYPTNGGTIPVNLTSTDFTKAL